MTISSRGCLDVKAASSLSLSYGTSGNTISTSDGKTIVSSDWWNYTPSYYNVNGYNQLVFSYSSGASFTLTVYYYDSSQAYLGYENFSVSGNVTRDFKYSDAKYIRLGLPNGATGSFKASVQYTAPAATPSPTPTPITYYKRDVSWYLGYVNTYDGTITTEYDDDYITNKIDISDTAEMKFTNSSSDEVRIYVVFYTADGTYCTGYMKDIEAGGEYERNVSELAYGQQYCIVGTLDVNTPYLTIYTDNEYTDTLEDPKEDTSTATPTPTSAPTAAPTAAPTTGPAAPTPAPTPAPADGETRVHSNWKTDVMLDINTGDEIEDDVSSATSGYLQIKDDASYTVGIGDISYENGLFIMYYDNSYTYLGYETAWLNSTVGARSYTLAIPSNASYMRLQSASVDSDDTVQAAIYNSIYLGYFSSLSDTVSSEALQAIEDEIAKGNAQSSAQHEEQLEVEQEQAETQKGILNQVTDFFGNFFENLKDFIIGIFVPSAEEMAALIDELTTFFSDKFGFLYYPFDFIIHAFDALMSEGNGTVIIFPGFSIMGYEVWPDIPVDIAENEIAMTFFETVRMVNGFILSLSFINYLRNFFEKRFGGGGN